MQLTRTLFWDTDYGKINWDKSARYVIARVCRFGFMSDWKQIVSYYGLDKIRQEMLNERDLDPKTLSFLSLILDVPKEKFRCYSSLQSPGKHWVY